MMTRLITACSILTLWTAGCADPNAKQPPTSEASVQPGVNEKFKGDLDVAMYKDKWESPDREVYREREAIVDLLDLKPGMVVADIGAGSGFYSLMFAETVGEHGRVYAVDIAPRFIEYIQTQATAARLSNISTIQCRDDSAELPLHSIDLAFICTAYHHFEYPKSYMTSIYNALKPEGELVIIEYHRDGPQVEQLPEARQRWLHEHMRFNRADLIQEVEEVGFHHMNDPDAPFLNEAYMVRFCLGD